MIVAARRLLTAAGRLEPGWVRVEGALLADVGVGDPPAAADHVVDLLAPGFVDAHCHGGGGASFGDGAEAAARAAQAHRRHGTTTVVASLVSEPVPRLADQVSALRPLVVDGVLGGLHLEGPWLSPAHPGAHDPAALAPPTAADVDRLLGAADGTLRMVTLAPEVPGAAEASRALRAAGVVVAAGHTDADAATTRRALDDGVTVVTHLFNAMRPLRHREPGPVGVALADPRVVVELIADGVHLAPEVVALAARAAAGGFVLVTDAMAAAAATDGDYRLGGLVVEVRDGVARLTTGAIAGSTLTMDAAVRGAVAAGVPLAVALTAASRTPAELFSLTDRGVVATGRRADLVALDDELAVAAVLHGGARVPLG